MHVLLRGIVPALPLAELQLEGSENMLTHDGRHAVATSLGALGFTLRDDDMLIVKGLLVLDTLIDDRECAKCDATFEEARVRLDAEAYPLDHHTHYQSVVLAHYLHRMRAQCAKLIRSVFR